MPMAEAATLRPPLPTRRPELVLRPLGDDGQHVVKDPITGSYFNLGPHEAFLLARLDGQTPADDLCNAFREQFQEPFGADDLDDFLPLAREQGFLARTPAPAVPTVAPTPAPAAAPP